MTQFSKRSLSLAARLDDLQRNLQILSQSCEPEFLKFVENQEQCRVKWAHSEEESERLRRENRNLEVRLQQARAQLDHEQIRAKKAEDLRRQSEDRLHRLEEVLEVMRDFLNNEERAALSNNRPDTMAFLKSFRRGQPSPTAGTPGSVGRHVSIVTPGSGGRRRSSRANERSAGSILDSRELDDEEDEENDVSQLRVAFRDVNASAPTSDKTPVDPNCFVNGKLWKRSESGSKLRHCYETDGEVATRTSHDREATNGFRTVIRSEERLEPTAPPFPVSDSTDESDIRGPYNNNATSRKRRSDDSDDSFLGVLNKRVHVEVADRDTPPKSQGAYSPTLARTPSARLQRNHVWVNKKLNYWEKCTGCSKRFAFDNLGMKCSDCRISVHPSCKDQVSQQCVRVESTPGAALSGGRLMDYCPSEPPHLPSLVVQCVGEIERRGLRETGLYRVNGSDKQVKELYEKWIRGKSIPNLHLVDDVNVICGCLKQFLRNLREPLVTFEQWPMFSRAANSGSMEDVLNTIRCLPLANMHTLAFMMLHLQVVASNCSSNQMSEDNLARVFAPTLVGNSGPALEPIEAVNENDSQQAILHLLLSVSGEFYEELLKITEYSQHRPHMLDTPQSSPGELRSMLGPLNSARKRPGEDTPYRAQLPDSWTKRKFFPEQK